jgi:hypothetical protein
MKFKLVLQAAVMAFPAGLQAETTVFGLYSSSDYTYSLAVPSSPLSSGGFPVTVLTLPIAPSLVILAKDLTGDPCSSFCADPTEEAKLLESWPALGDWSRPELMAPTSGPANRSLAHWKPTSSR